MKRVFKNQLLKKRLVGWLFLLFVWSMGIALNAQGSVLVFNIDSFVQRVKTSNIQLKIAEQENQKQHKYVNESRAAYLPQLNVQGGYQRNFNDQKMYFEFFDFANINEESGDIPTTIQKFNVGFNHDFQANVLLEQNILSLNHIYNLKAAKVFAQIGDLQLIDKNNEIISEAKKVFMQAVLMEHVFKLNQLTEENAKKNFEIAKNKFEHKLIAEIELLQAKIRWENEIPKTKQAKRNYISLLNSLKIIAGLSPSDSIIIKYQFEQGNLSTPTKSYAEILNHREDFQMLSKSVDLQQYLIKQKKAAYIPTLTGQLVYGYMSSSNQWNLNDNVNKPFYAGITLTLPIFSGGYRQTQVQKSKLQYNIAQLKQTEAKQAVLIEVENLKMKLQEEYQIIQAATSTFNTAQRAYNLANNNHSTGLISQLDLRKYSEDFKKAQLNLYWAVYNYQCSKIEYNRAIGNNE